MADQKPLSLDIVEADWFRVSEKLKSGISDSLESRDQRQKGVDDIAKKVGLGKLSFKGIGTISEREKEK